MCTLLNHTHRAGSSPPESPVLMFSNSSFRWEPTRMQWSVSPHSKTTHTQYNACTIIYTLACCNCVCFPTYIGCMQWSYISSLCCGSREFHSCQLPPREWMQCQLCNIFRYRLVCSNKCMYISCNCAVIITRHPVTPFLVDVCSISKVPL